MWKKILRSSVNFIPWPLRRQVKNMPGVAQFQRWFFNKTLAGQSFVHVINAGPAKGLVYPVCLPRDKAIWAGTYEAPFADALAKAVQGQDVCYDIGGYRGFMSGVCARAGAGLVVVFEPFPPNCTQVRYMADLNPTLSIRLEPIAVGDRDGEVEFRVMPKESMGKLAESPFQPEVMATTAIRVPIRRLDSLLAEKALPPPNVIKIDVEGAELLVLQGALQLLREHHPRLLLEAHSPDLAEACTALLESMRYRVLALQQQAESVKGAETEVRHLVAYPTS